MSNQQPECPVGYEKLFSVPWKADSYNYKSDRVYTAYSVYTYEPEPKRVTGCSSMELAQAYVYFQNSRLALIAENQQLQQEMVKALIQRDTGRQERLKLIEQNKALAAENAALKQRIKEAAHA